MVDVEIYKSEDEILMSVTLPFMPRVGEYLSLDSGGYFSYYYVVEVWIRQDSASRFIACLQVELKD